MSQLLAVRDKEDIFSWEGNYVIIYDSVSSFEVFNLDQWRQDNGSYRGFLWWGHHLVPDDNFFCLFGIPPFFRVIVTIFLNVSSKDISAPYPSWKQFEDSSPWHGQIILTICAWLSLACICFSSPGWFSGNDLKEALYCWGCSPPSSVCSWLLTELSTYCTRVSLLL